MASSVPHCRSDDAHALAAFKHDCNENTEIARLLRGELRDWLIPPVLEVGAGAGEIASSGFPDLEAVLLDLDRYPSTHPNHRRITGDFMTLDLSEVKNETILFCHSLYYFYRDMDALRHRLTTSGARTALVVANESKGQLKQVIDGSSKLTAGSLPAFYVDVPGLRSERVASFRAQLRCDDFSTLATHLTRVLLNIPFNMSLIDSVARHLPSVLPGPGLEIDEAVYRYELRQ